MKRVPALAFLFVSSAAYAQTTGTPAPTTPPLAADSSGVNWLWILIILAIVAAAIWYFTKKRRGATTAAGVSGVNRTTTGTTTTSTTTPPAGPNVYSSKDSKDPKR
jgi:hypothetical protein